MSQLDIPISGPNAVSQSTPDEVSAQTLYDKCDALARNLWWTWHPEVITLFRDLDPIRWRQLAHNPIALLKEFTAEFGIHESVPIYSGGLGVLSGDHIKSASGLGVPLIAVGLFYDQGYFKQHLDDNGYQLEEYMDTKVENLPIQQALSPGGEPIMVRIDTRTGPLLAKVRHMQVGRVPLYLLDCDVEGNSPEDRELTSRLYGGDERTRIRQELVLGIGGMRALKALGIAPGVFHLNEGHSAFAPLEAIRERMEEDGMHFDDALREVAQHTVFTTHTPVPAGHDRFDGQQVEEHLGPLRDSLGISYEQLMGLGRVEPQNESESFCMTVLGLKLSRRANAVSSLHGYVSRRMWAHLWPWRVEEEIPIGHITNGVHIPSWLAHQMQQLYDRHFGAEWQSRMGESTVWQGIHDVDPGELWETHNALKSLLLAFVRRRVSRQCRRRGESDEAVEAARNLLDPSALTIGFGRRFATYKRATLILRDMDRALALVQDQQRPVQFIFAGKAHPKDEPGKQLIQLIANIRHDERFCNRVVFIEDYDINVCRHLIQGVDVWLNNPRRPLEASGTSGQKAVLNGALNFSVLDGWWAEGYDGANGFAIGKGGAHVSDDISDKRDGEALYQVLEKQIVPLFYDRDIDGLPRQWIQMMINSISTLAWRFSAHRMVADYTRTGYVPAGGGLSCDMGSQ